jgi:membrane-associated protease RseP (regulator of RpoE activity)
MEAWLRSLQPSSAHDVEASRPVPPRSAWRAWGLNLVFFLLTVLSVEQMGGMWLVLGLMPILVAHEMGHYVACRLYRVDATLPYFIPAPLLSFVGTLGAFIRIRGQIPHRRALFDIGIAGPLAGFVVCLPVLVLGALEATIIPTPPATSPYFISFGDPLLVQWTYDWVRGSLAEGQTFLMGPLATASWFGLFVTALNLIPVGQLDGGHVIYAMLGARATVVSRLAMLGCLGLLYLRPTWLVWCVLLLLFGRRHPPTAQDHLPLGAGRVAVGLLGFGVLAVCFTPSPIIVTWSDFFSALSSLLTSG